MVNVSKKYLDTALKVKVWGKLWKQIKKVQSGNELEKILAKKLTSKELIMLEKRLAIEELISRGIRHNEIKRILDVASQTISFTKRGLKK